MHPELQKLLQLNFFKKEGFVRKKCKKCGAYFWTKEERQTCNEYPCSDYSFIGNPVGKKMGISQMRKEFLHFFEKNGHKVIRRYPVVARWRDDIYLTIASIADFQPHVTSGLVPPPANPLVISQPSIRLNDLEEVGISGRHLTIFEMMGHHAFNNSQKIYWNEETIQYCNDFLASIGIDDVVYKEAEWSGGGNAGACLEVIVNGLEIATLVFMNLKENSNGKYIVKGAKYDEMPLKIVDTGYGLERIVWLVNGSKTIYDAIFPEVIKKIGEENQYVYAIADHTKCLAFMLGDGVVPSNTGVGYLARLLIRRSLRFLDKIESNKDMFYILNEHLKYLKKDFPELAKEKERMKEILEIETQKYYSTIERGTAMVRRMGKKKRIGINDLIKLYDSHGIHPEIVKEIVGIDIPKNFESLVAEMHAKVKKEKKKEAKEYNFETKPIYYEDEHKKEFDAKVIYKGNDFVILDKTLFYPEGGGQKNDVGYLIQNGRKYRVKKVEKAGKAILHYVNGLDKGKVHGVIDWERRYAMMRHHTATHVINAAARMKLGNHIWQAGSDLDENEARLDVTHYKRISTEEAREIEKIANRIVSSSLPVKKEFIPRNIAEKKYGMRLYQGGAPKSSIIRVVEIPGIDAEACGGTHVDNTAEIGMIKIIGIERIQDGVERIRFCAGDKALEYIQKQEDILKNLSEKLQTDFYELPEVTEKIIKENRQLRKEIEKLQKGIGMGKAIEYKGIKIIMQDGLLKEAIRDLTKEKSVVISTNKKNDNIILTIASSPDLSIDCSSIAKAVASKLGGGGGGRKTVAQAGIKLDKIEEAKKIVLEMIKEGLDKTV